MTDIKSHYTQLYLRSEELHQGMELLFFAYRAFTAEADAILARYGFGRAHHRVIYFVGRQPGMPVSSLLSILKIKKQSLSRVLGQLLDEGFIEQKPGATDRRQRLLHLTTRGRELESLLSSQQRALMTKAYKEAGPDAVAGFRAVLLGLLDPDDLKRFQADTSAGARETGA